MSIKTTDERYIAHTYKRFDVTIVRGKGALCWDENGREYIDMTSGIGVNSFGWSDPAWAQAVAQQAELLQHTSNLYYTAPCAELAELLCARTGMSKVFFCNSGAEANECAVKVARKYAAEHKGAEYYNIITLNKSFHGRTLTTLAATGQEHFHQLFTPLTEGFLYAQPEDIGDMSRLIADNKVAAVLLEVVQGEGGVNALSADYLNAVQNLCRENDILLMIDEVQTGNGRTGKFYSYMNYGLEPDVVTTAKGLAGGLPMGACLMNGRTADVLSYGDHGSTFGGNPVCAAVGRQPHGRGLPGAGEPQGRVYPRQADRRGLRGQRPRPDDRHKDIEAGRRGDRRLYEGRRAVPVRQGQAQTPAAAEYRQQTARKGC